MDAYDGKRRVPRSPTQQESAELFFKAVPEAALNADSKAFIEIGMGLHRLRRSPNPPPIHERPRLTATSRSYEDHDRPRDEVHRSARHAKRPTLESWYTNDYAGHVKLAKARAWDKHRR